MRLTAAFFANHVEVVDGMLDVQGGCWTSTRLANGATGFGCQCVIMCDSAGDDVAQKFTLLIDVKGPLGRVWGPAMSWEFEVAGPMAFISTPPISLPVEPSGGRHVYTVRLQGHAEKILLPLEIFLPLEIRLPQTKGG